MSCLFFCLISVYHRQPIVESGFHHARHLWRSQFLGLLEEEGTTLNTRRRKFQIHVLEAFPLKHIEATWATDMFKKSLLNLQVFSWTLCELSHVNTSLIYFRFFVLILFVIVTTVAALRRGKPKASSINYNQTLLCFTSYLHPKNS